MKKVLITGGTGFIGSQVVAELLRKGYEVHSLVYPPFAPEQPNLVQHEMNLMDDKAVDAFLADNSFDTLIHLAWFTGAKCHSSDVNLDWMRASIALLETFVKHGGKTFLGAGTVSEYDFSKGYLREDITPLTNPSLYGQAKAAVYNTGRIFAKAHDVAFKWARIFNLYGPNEKPTRLMPSVLHSMLAGEDVRVSDCVKIQDYSHVFDTAAAIVSFLESDVTGAVNICSGNPIRLRVIVEKMAELTGFKGEILWGAIPANFDDPFVVGDNTRLTREVGYHHKYDLETGLKQIIDWEKNHV